MANFNVDTNGNLWIGTNVSNTFSTAQGQSDTKFYVTSAGAIHAESGDIGGIVVDADGVESSNYDAATNTGWRLDNSTGIAQYFDIDIQLPNTASGTPSPTSRIDIGNSLIYDLGNQGLTVSSTALRTSKFKAIAIGSASNPPIAIQGDYDELGFYATNDTSFQYTTMHATNGTNDVFHWNGLSTNVTFHGNVTIEGDQLTVNSDSGGNNQFLGYDGSGTLGFHTVSGSSHPDSDHTSFANSSHSHTESDISDIGSHSHGNLDNYQKWILKGNGNNLNVISGYGVEFKAGSGISLSVNTSPYEITFSHGGGTHVSSSTAVQALFPGGIRGSVTLGSDTTGRFFDGIGQSGQNYTWQTTTSFNGTPTFSGTINVGSNIFHPTPNDGNGFIGFSSNRFNRVYASNGVSTSSDERLKQNIENIPFGLDYLNSLRPVQFEWIPKYKDECTICGCVVQEGNDNCGNCWEDVTNEEGQIIDKTYCACETTSVKITGNKKLWGFIAQELIATPPEPDIDIELVDYDSEEDAYNMNYPQLIAPLVKAVQELSTQISDLTARIEVLEG